MRMLQEPVRRFRESVEEDAYRFVNFVVELIRDGNVEEPMKQPAMNTPDTPVMHQREGPRGSHSGVNSRWPV